MEVKKSPKASLENKRLLFTEIGFVLALLGVRFQLFKQRKAGGNSRSRDSSR